MSDDRLRVARSCANPVEVELVRGLLTSAGIAAIISRDDSSGLGPDSWIVEGVSVLVRESDAVAAAEVLNALEQAQPGS